MQTVLLASVDVTTENKVVSARPAALAEMPTPSSAPPTRRVSPSRLPVGGGEHRLWLV